MQVMQGLIICGNRDTTALLCKKVQLFIPLLQLISKAVILIFYFELISKAVILIFILN